MRENENARASAIAANRILLVTLFVYLGSSFVIDILNYLLGDKISFLGDSFFGLVVGQVMLVVPSVVYMMYKKVNVRGFLRIKLIRIPTVILIIFLAYASYPIITLCSYLSLQVSENIISTTMEDMLIKYPTVVSVIGIALIPCMVEEIIFRGVLFQSYRKAGLLKGLIITSLLFGMFHMNINQMSYAVVIGVLFICLNEATGSILSSILVHFIINGTSVYASIRVMKSGLNLTEVSNSTEAGTQSLVIMCLMAVVSLFFVVLLLWAIAKIEGRIPLLKEQWQQRKEKARVLVISPSLVIAFLICTVMMVAVQVAMMIKQ